MDGPVPPIRNHRFEHVPFKESPNQDARPDAEDISLIIIHAISLPPGEFGMDGVEALFLNTLDPDAHPYYRGIAHLRVSAHLVIDRSGGLTQFVDFNKRAWHAGLSVYGERTSCNDFSIGIELLGTEDLAFEESQYEALASVLESLTRHYPDLSLSRVTGHEHVSPGRKWDPGPNFNWRRIGVNPEG